MNFVLAKIKRVRKNPYRKLLSDIDLFQPVSLNSIQVVEYNADHKLDEDSWFVVTEFSKSSFFPPSLPKEYDGKDFNNISRAEFLNINCLLSIQDDDVYFQKVSSSMFVKKKVVKFGDIAEVETGQHRILVKDQPDAVFFVKKDTMIFRDIATVSSIFKGIDQLYKEATQEDVDNFLRQDFLDLQDGFSGGSVSKPNRKRLALVLSAMDEMSEARKKDLVDYISEYCGDRVPLSNSGDSFSVSNDVHLKFVLYGLAERFYTTQYSEEKRLANSVEAL